MYFPPLLPWWLFFLWKPGGVGRFGGKQNMLSLGALPEVSLTAE